MIMDGSTLSTQGASFFDPGVSNAERACFFYFPFLYNFHRTS